MANRKARYKVVEYDSDTLEITDVYFVSNPSTIKNADGNWIDNYASDNETTPRGRLWYVEELQ